MLEELVGSSAFDSLVKMEAYLSLRMFARSLLSVNVKPSCFSGERLQCPSSVQTRNSITSSLIFHRR